MLYTEQNVKDNLRNRAGKRVFYLGKEDRLTPGARDFLTRERIPILAAAEARREDEHPDEAEPGAEDDADRGGV